MNNFALNIQILRKSTGKKQEEIAASAGFGRSTWGNYESGTSVPNLADLIRISQFFGVTLTQLVEEDLSNDVALIDKMGDSKLSVKSSPKGSGIGSSNDENSAKSHLLNEAEQAYLLSRDVVERRLKEKDDIISALKGQIEALKLAVSQMQQRLEPK